MSCRRPVALDVSVTAGASTAGRAGSPPRSRLEGARASVVILREDEAADETEEEVVKEERDEGADVGGGGDGEGEGRQNGEARERGMLAFLCLRETRGAATGRRKRGG